MSTSDHDHDHDHEHTSGTVAPAPAKGALTSLAALGAALNSVDTASVMGRSGRPMMQFKAREGDGGTWMFGQRRTIPEDGSLWAVNPTSFRHGYVCFGDGKMLDERLVSVGQPKPNLAELPDLGFKWQEEWAVGMKCLSGIDAGTETDFKSSTVGGAQAIVGLIDAVRDRLNGGQHGDKISPIVRLDRDSYPHGQYGRTNTPQTPIVDWMALRGPPPTPTSPSSPPPTEQPRRRRVA